MREALRRSAIVACSIAIVACSVVARAQTVDGSFDPGANQIVLTIAVQPDGKTVVGGNFTGLGGTTGTTVRNRIGRLNANGTVDTFNPGTNGPVQAVAVQPDGKILAGGNFTAVGGGVGTATARSHIARFNADGSVDTSFDPGANLNVYALAVQPDGKILVGGNFSKLGGGGAGVTTRIGIGRLNADGSVDAGFDPGASKLPSPGAPPEIYTILLQPDGKILLGGYFNGLGGGTGTTARNFIGRLLANGTVDTFNPGVTSISGVNALALQADGKILVGGTFTQLAGTNRANLGRLHPDGSLDAGFNPGAETQVLTLAVQTDGRILAGGYFKWLGDAGGPSRFVRNYIGRMNADGAVDATFNPGANNAVNVVAVQADGAIVVGGIFDHLGNGSVLTGGTLRNRIGRLTNTSVANHTAGDTDGDGRADLVVFRSGTWFTLRSLDSAVSSVQFGLSNDVPVQGDYDGDGRSDIAVYRPSTGVWYLLQTTGGFTAFQFGLVGDAPVPADYDGDHKTDIAVYRPSAGVWYILQSSTSTLTTVSAGIGADIPVPADYDGDGKADVTVFRPLTGEWIILRSTTTTLATYQFGLPGDVPVPGDYDGDARADLAVYRPSSRNWYLARSTTNYASADIFQWGAPGDIAEPRDYDGDGKTDIAVFRPSTSTWFVLQSSTGFATSVSTQFGLAGDTAVPGAVIANAIARVRIPLANLTPYNDFDGDRTADLTVYRPSTGEWFTLKSVGGFASSTSLRFGLTGDIPVPGDYDGDRKADVAVFRPSSGAWYILKSSDSTFSSLQWGLTGDIPVPGDYDGDSRTDIAVYRPSSGSWYILKSSDLSVTVQQFGLSSDTPVPADYDNDGVTDLAVWRPSTAVWYILESATQFTTMVQFRWGLTGDIPVPGDFNGDGKADLGVWRPSDGTWYISQSPAVSPTTVIRQFGLPGDIPVAGDYDGDGKTDVAVFRPSSGFWFLLPSSTSVTASYRFGLTGDIPILKRP